MRSDQDVEKLARFLASRVDKHDWWDQLSTAAKDYWRDEARAIFAFINNPGG